MRRSVVVGLSLALAGCPKEPVTMSSDTGDPSTGSPTTSSTETPTGSGSSSGGTTEAVTSTTTAATMTTSSTGTEAAVSTGDASSGSAETSSGGTTTTGTSEDGDSTTGPPPLLFDCYGCECDAHEYYCQQVFNGVVEHDARERRMCPVVEPDTLDNGCVPIPDRCEGIATCACLPQMNGMCYCNEVETGVFEVVCPLP